MNELKYYQLHQITFVFTVKLAIKLGIIYERIKFLHEIIDYFEECMILTGFIAF